tara:strand:+ start:19074 stop:19259 length:186 start_codon:yes stop_codon:yes gene_type:complete
MSDCKEDRMLCDFVVVRMTDYGSQGTNMPYVAVELYCEGCERTAYSSCSWIVDPEDLEVYE